MFPKVGENYEGFVDHVPYVTITKVGPGDRYEAVSPEGKEFVCTRKMLGQRVP